MLMTSFAHLSTSEMIRRPLHKKFGEAVTQGRKITTIRDNPWPIGVPIMLYHWSGAPYRSPQIDVAAVIVEETTPIRIGRNEGEMMFFHEERNIHRGKLLWYCEGFLSRDEMDEWFRAKMKPGQWVDKALMRFRLQRQVGYRFLGMDSLNRLIRYENDSAARAEWKNRHGHDWPVYAVVNGEPQSL